MAPPAASTFTTQLGSIESFDPAQEDWSSYSERFEQFVIANGLADDEKKIVAVFLTSIGSKTYNLLRNLTAPDKPSDFKWADLTKTLSEHFNPKPIVIAERFHFHKREQNDGESVAEYCAALKKSSERCEFKTFLEEALRDRLVCGLRSKQIQKRLLAESELTWQSAQKIAIAMESADKQANKFRPGTTTPISADVNALTSRSKENGNRKDQRSCFRCGGSHAPQQCRFKDVSCRFCKLKGHLERVCKKKANESAGHTHNQKPQKPKPLRYVEIEESEEVRDEYSLFKIGQEAPEPSIIIPLKINGTEINLELDTGSSVSILSEQTWKSTFPGTPLHASNLKLKTYSGEQLKVVGQATVEVQYEEQSFHMPIQVVEGNGPSLFGRNWLKSIKLNWATIKKLSTNLDDILHKYSNVFKDELGTMKDVKAKLYVKEGSKPKFFKPRPVPHALKGAIEVELDRLVGMGVLEQVRYSEFASPIVPIVKPDSTIRICGDYKVTLNSLLEVDQFPLPNPEDLFVTLSGGEKFTKLDLSRAYQQILLEEESREYVTINTHKGLYRPTRLPYGVASATAIFQSKIEQVLQGIPMVVCRVDDILVSGKTDQEHLANLGEVLSRLENAGLRLKLAKCRFMQPSVEYLGYRVDARGLHAIEKKVQAIRDAPAPENQQQLKSFLGMITYYAKFIEGYSTITHPLNELLRDNVKWTWGKRQRNAFSTLKAKLASAPVLMHYNEELPLKLATDASAYGVGAVISHILPNGQERPIAYASRTLNKSERNYSQLDKEALSIIFGVRRFHQYLYGRKFLLETDHRPLVHLLGPKSEIPTLAAARLQRWAILLSAYQYDIVHRSTDKHANADCLSRLPLPVSSKSEDDEEVKLINQQQIESLPLRSEQIKKVTRADPILSKVLEHTLAGWPEVNKNADLEPYFQKRNEITVEDGCLLWGIRVIIPKSFRPRVLEELHSGHPGVVRMKSLARLHVWWPKLDKDILSVVRDCAKCQLARNKPQTAPLHPWEWPKAPWQRIHIDFAGPFMNKMFLVVVDSHSKWLEVEIMPNITSQSTIERLRDLFARFGLPMQLVSDNGPQFTSQEFAEFMKENGIKHTLVAPYHPRSNGQAERFVQTFKQYFKTEGTDSIKQSLARFLFNNRNTPSSVTGQTPSELFLRRRPRTRLDLLRPDVGRKVLDKQISEKGNFDRSSKERKFLIGEEVLVQNFRGEPKWLEAIVTERTGPVSYKVQVNDQVWKRHVDQMRNKSYSSNQNQAAPATETAEIFIAPSTQPHFDLPLREGDERTDSAGANANANADADDARVESDPQQTADSQHRYPTRDRNPPVRLGFDE